MKLKQFNPPEVVGSAERRFKRSIPFGDGFIEIPTVIPDEDYIPTPQEILDGLREAGKIVIPIFCYTGETSLELAIKENKMIERRNNPEWNKFLFDSLGCNNLDDSELERNKFLALMRQTKVVFALEEPTREKVRAACRRYGVKRPPLIELIPLKSNGYDWNPRYPFRRVRDIYKINENPGT